MPDIQTLIELFGDSAYQVYEVLIAEGFAEYADMMTTNAQGA